VNKITNTMPMLVVITLLRISNGGAPILHKIAAKLAISAMLYFKPLPLPLATFDTLASAETWVAERLQEARSTQTGTQG